MPYRLFLMQEQTWNHGGPRMNAIFTIGYEGALISEFIHTLKRSEVSILLDIREIPLSRKKGFSKTALAAAAQKAGIKYQHEKLLGSPKTIRDKLRQDGNYKSFFKAFDVYLQTQTALLAQLAKTIKGNVVLMCYERDPLTCHRLSVAKKLEELTGKKPKHLAVLPQGRGNAPKAAYLHIGQSLPAA